MKNYNQKDGMLMIFRAIIMTIIALVIFFVLYRIYKPKVKVEVNEQQDLSEVTFCISSNGSVYKIK